MDAAKVVFFNFSGRKEKVVGLSASFVYNLAFSGGHSKIDYSNDMIV